MFVKGIGKIKKEEAMSILTKEGRETVKDGTITLEELGLMYKMELVRKASKWGDYQDTFHRCWERIPITITESATVEDLAELVDAFQQCYSDGVGSHK